MKKLFSSHNEKGFTLIEMVFVFVIFAVMSSITLFNFRGFNQKLEFNNLVQDIALRIITAQKSSISGSTNINFLGQTARPSYGVYFKASPTPTVDSRQFIYYNDLPDPAFGSTGNKMYDPPGGPCPSTPLMDNECLSVTAITTGEYVSNICYVVPGGALGTCNTSGEAHITFIRPFPDAAIRVDAGAMISIPQHVCIELTSAKDMTIKKTIAVSNLGEVRTLEGAAGASTSPCRT
jgi:prepilin-type N-terminal cleavage/methylation domain-containing protein